jgi:hypothetical protein
VGVEDGDDNSSDGSVSTAVSSVTLEAAVVDVDVEGEDEVNIGIG